MVAITDQYCVDRDIPLCSGEKGTASAGITGGWEVVQVDRWIGDQVDRKKESGR